MLKVLVKALPHVWLLLTAAGLGSCASPPSDISPQPAPPTPPVVIPPDPPPSPPAPTVEEKREIDEHGAILMAFLSAYPGIISSVEFVDEDWRMNVNGSYFYYAHGRMLPQELRHQWEQFSPWDFYQYPWTGAEKERLKAFSNPVYSIGSSFLFDTMFSSPDEDSSWELQEKYNFLGAKLLIHPYIREPLDRVRSRVRAEAVENREIREWIAELQTVPISGWTWRTIAGTQRRSTHSYGTAIDLLPKEMHGRSTYWQWDQKTGSIRRTQIYTPPAAVITAFEDNGFIWGGNWDIIDTMHFEYRPEILLLNNIPFTGK